MSNCSCRLVQSIEPSMESELKNFATVLLIITCQSRIGGGEYM